MIELNDETLQSALVVPAATAARMREAMGEYTRLCTAVLDQTDYQAIGGKTFKKRSAWQKLATAFSVSTEIIKEKVHVDDDGRVIRAEFVVRATAPNGRHEDGYGAASARERSSTKPDHDIPATAETRARNRACANLFAFGELTAEEADADTRPHTVGPRPVPRPLNIERRQDDQQAPAEVNSSPRDNQEPASADYWRDNPAQAVDTELASLRMEAIEKQTALTKALPKYRDASEEEIWLRSQDLLNASIGMHFGGHTLLQLDIADLRRVHKMLDEAIERKREPR